MSRTFLSVTLEPNERCVEFIHNGTLGCEKLINTKGKPRRKSETQNKLEQKSSFVLLFDPLLLPIIVLKNHAVRNLKASIIPVRSEITCNGSLNIEKNPFKNGNHVHLSYLFSQERIGDSSTFATLWRGQSSESMGFICFQTPLCILL